MLQPNYKARLARAVRNNVPTQSAFETFRRFRWFTLFLVILFPIYPSLAALGQASESQTGDYDASSILFQYVDTRGAESYISDTGLVRVDLDTISGSSSEDVSPVASGATAPIPESNIKTYTVVENDDIIKIAKKYDTDPDVVLWANSLSMSDTLKVGQTLVIPPVSGLIHTIGRGETISVIAQQYNISSDAIMSANNIADATKVRDGRKILIPGAVRPVAVATPAPPAATRTPATQKPQTSTPAEAEKPVVIAAKEESAPVVTTTAAANGLKSSYKVEYTGLGRGFVAGNCTWHVARNKTVTWRGNANQWMRNAKAQGVPTGQTPIPGAIVQFSGNGYNPYYGHVGIVTEVSGDTITVSDMNYAGLYKVTIRQVSIDDPAIDGYIYVD